MATCPRCKGHLTDSHRCPRRPWVVALEISLWVIAGALCGFLLVLLFDRSYGQISDTETMYFVLAGGLAGAVLHRGLRS
jgi:hypothetical protein